MSVFENFDWSTTPLGPRAGWSPALMTVHDMMMSAHVAMCAAWGPDQTFLYNAAYAPFLGSRHPAALGQPMPEVWPELWGEIGPLIQRAMAGERVQFESHHLVMTRNDQPEDTWWDFSYSALRDGDEVKGFLNVTTEATHHVLSGQRRDVTEAGLRQQVADKTAELRLYGDIIQSSIAPICAFDKELRLIAFNQAHSDEFFRIFKYRVQIGEVFPDLFPPDQAPIIRGFMARALTGEAYTVTEEFGDPDLAKPYWEVSYSPLRNSVGEVIGAFHYAKDISDRLRAEAELATTQEALRQSQKMEAVGQLTGGVAHDFNNLLTVIKSSSDLLQRPNLPEDRRTRYVAAIADTVDRAAKLTGQLLAFARRQVLKPRVFDACDGVRAIAEMMGTLTGSRITIVTQLPDHPCLVHADPSQFDTALVNLAVNARDAMDGAGTLTVSVRMVEEVPARRAHGIVPGAHVAVSLQDTGSGIAPEMMEKIFEPFFTTKAVGKGTGLGLSQVIGFAKQSGGDVIATSTPGEGTTFTLYLPRGTPDAQDGDELADRDAPPAKPGTRILVVEDNADVGAISEQSLTDLGYVVALAASADEAITMLGRDPHQFDVVFSDVVMPGRSGIELAQDIRRQYPQLGVVLTSGYSHVLAENGNHGFELLQKPYSIEQLARVLGKATRGRRKRAGNS